MCWASTTRQHRPVSRRTLDESAAGVQVANDVHQTRHRPNQADGGVAQHGVLVLQPGARCRCVAAHDGVQGPEEPQKKYGEFERLVAGRQEIRARAHAGDRGLRQAEHPRQHPVGQPQPRGRAQQRLGHDRGFVSRPGKRAHTGLKAHYPLEFMVGVINNFGGFYRTEFYFHEARMNGAIIEAPCINHSEYLTTLYANQIYIGFIHLKSLETKVAKQISIEREQNGNYKSLDNFLRRITLSLEQVRILIRMGSFRFTEKNKQRLLWEAMLFLSNTKSRTKMTAQLFDTDSKEFPLPVLQRSNLEDAFDEIELLGFPLCDPFQLVATADRGDILAHALLQKLGKRIHILGYVVTTKNTSTKKGELMHFGTFYDQQGEVFDTVHFPDVARSYPFRGRGFYSIKGKVVEDFGIAMIEVTFMEKLPMISKRAEEFMREAPQEMRGVQQHTTHQK